MFKRGSLIRVILLLVTLLFGGYWFRSCVRVDRCLDGGDRWNKSIEACEYAESTPITP